MAGTERRDALKGLMHDSTADAREHALSSDIEQAAAVPASLNRMSGRGFSTSIRSMDRDGRSSLARETLSISPEITAQLRNILEHPAVQPGVEIVAKHVLVEEARATAFSPGTSRPVVSAQTAIE